MVPLNFNIHHHIQYKKYGNVFCVYLLLVIFPPSYVDLPIFSFYKSLEISIIISYLIIVLILFANIKIGINIIIMELFLVLLIHKEEKKKDIYFQKFILERYFNKYNYKKSIMINSIRKLYKYKTNYIKIGKNLYTEKEFIALNYQIFNKKC